MTVPRCQTRGEMGAGVIALVILSLVIEAATYRAVPGAVMVPIDSNTDYSSRQDSLLVLLYTSLMSSRVCSARPRWGMETPPGRPCTTRPSRCD